MKPRALPTDAFHLFQAHFHQLLNLEHPLIQLADRIDWPRFDAAFADSDRAELGASAKAIRMMVGLQYLKYTFNESDESVVERWVENPYRQYFRGFTHLQHETPINIVPTAAGSNLRRLLRRFVFALRDWLAEWPESIPMPPPLNARRRVKGTFSGTTK